jgi:hypothetical protein
MKVSLSHGEILQAVSDFMFKRNLRIPDVEDGDKFQVTYSEATNEISIEIRDVEVAPVAAPAPEVLAAPATAKPKSPNRAVRFDPGPSPKNPAPMEPEGEMSQNADEDAAATAQSIRALAAQNAQSLARRPAPTKPDVSSLNRFQRVEMSRDLDDLFGKEMSDMSDEIG